MAKMWRQREIEREEFKFLKGGYNRVLLGV